MIISMQEALIFINQAVYCYGLIPQIVGNYKQKSGLGLSDFLLWTMFNAFATLTFYFFCLSLPVGYCVSLTLQLMGSVILIAQRLYYDGLMQNVPLILVYIMNIIAFCALIPYSLQYPTMVGNITGWIGLILVIVGRIPQVVKIYKARSVQGFSYGFVLFLGMGSLLELLIVLMYKLPVQTLATASWALLSFAIFTCQFWLYKWRST